MQLLAVNALVVPFFPPMTVDDLQPTLSSGFCQGTWKCLAHVLRSDAATAAQAQARISSLFVVLVVQKVQEDVCTLLPNCLV